MADDVADIYKAVAPPSDPYKAVNDVSSMQNKLLGVQQQQTQVDSGKVDLAFKQMNHMRNILSDIATDPELGRSDLSKKITERASYGAKMGLFTPQQVVEGLKTMPSTPREQYAWIRDHLAQVMSATEKMGAYFGTPETRSVGGGEVTTQTPGLPGLPVQERSSRPFTVPPTQPTVVTSGVDRGAGRTVGGSGIAPLEQGTGSMPGGPAAARPAPMAPQAAPGGRQAPAVRPAPQPVQTSLAPGETERMGSAVNAYNAASAATGQYSVRVNPLRKAIPILERMKPTDIGPTSERWNDIKSIAQTLGAGPLAGIDPEKIKDYNELKKYFNQYTSQAAATLGPKTNEGLATAVTSNPNVNMDKLSATDLAKMALGIERMQAAAVKEFKELVDARKVPANSFHDFMIDWGTKQDPRAFVYDMLDEKAQEKVRNLPPAEREKVKEGMRIAKKHGLLGDVHRE